VEKLDDKIRPDHYKDETGRELWEDMIALYGLPAFVSFCKLNAFKYRMRAGRKNGQTAVTDIKKALWYEKKISELTVKSK